MKLKHLTVLVYLLVFFLPFQVGFHFWPSFAYVAGNKIDYLSPTIHFLDLLCWAIIVAFFSLNRKNSLQILRNQPGFKQVVWVWFLVCLSTLVSTIPLLSLYASVRLVEVSLTAFIVASTFRKINLGILLTCLNISGLLESGLAINQFIFQQSFNIKWLGERVFSAQTFGIAKAEVFDQLLMRPYGSFPHPNVLGAYLVAVLVVNFFALEKLSTKAANSRLKAALYLVSALEFIALVLTFSRSAWLSLFLVLLVLLVKFKSKLRIAVVGVGLSILLFSQIHPLLSSESVSRRGLFNEAGLQFLIERPLFGIGNYAFIPQFASRYSNTLAVEFSTYLQPIHNYWLLAAAEVGFLTSLLIVWLLLRGLLNSFRTRQWLTLCLGLTVLVLSLADHYFWSLIQGQLIFWLIIAIVNSEVKYNENL